MRFRRKRLSEEEFAAVVEQAIARVPEKIREALGNMVITVQDKPSAELLEDLGFAPDDELFGVYSGIPLSERNVTEPPLYPDIIYIFRESLENYCRSRRELIQEIEITVVHEIAHYLGFDEAQLQDLGYG
jgi:predicted Zn-dependent protease with MMP-like domain